MENETLRDRMTSYENVSAGFLMRKSYTVVRVDGKSFHTYTKRFKRPYDLDFMAAMDCAAVHLCKQASGAKLAYVQSDEISIVMTDFDQIDTQPWFGGKVQKICSVTASMATAAFNARIVADRLSKWDLLGPPIAGSLDFAEFDSRVFQLPNLTEVGNYLFFRQLDARRNSISSCAQSEFSQSKLHGKSGDSMREMLHMVGKPWEEAPEGYKMGRLVRKVDDAWTVAPAPHFPDFQLEPTVPNLPPYRQARYGDPFKVGERWFVNSTADGMYLRPLSPDEIAEIEED